MHLPYLQFSRGERRGIFALILVVIGLHTAIWLYPAGTPAFSTSNDPDLQKWLAGLDTIQTTSERFGYAYHHERAAPFKPWEKQRLPPLSPPRPRDGYQTVIELNTADSATLEKLPGIGSKLASRIVRYRDRLGGFYRLEQLNEVFGLSAETQRLFAHRLTLQTQHVQRIAVNQADLDELGRHPYIRYGLARLLVNYRMQHGAISNEEALKKLPFISDTVLIKLRPYLDYR